MLPLKSLGTLVCFLQSVSSTLKKFHAFSPCQVFMVLSDALGGCVIVFSFRFPPNLVMLSAYLAHDCVVEAFQNDYFYSPPSTAPLLGYKCVHIHMLGNLSSADVTGRATLSLMEPV